MSKRDKAKIDRLARALVLAVSRIKKQPTGIYYDAVMVAADRLDRRKLCGSARCIRGLTEYVWRAECGTAIGQ